MDFDLTPLLSDPAAWAALISLVVMEVVLGIDNLIFISILSGKLPPEQQAKALAAAKREREHAEAAKQAQVDAELEALRRKLGK